MPQFPHTFKTIDDYKICTFCNVIVVSMGGPTTLYIDSQRGPIEGSRRYKCVKDEDRQKPEGFYRRRTR